MKMYIAVLDEFPDYMSLTLVCHSILNAHVKFQDDPDYQEWFANSFKKCVVRVNQKEFDKIAALDKVHLGHENTTLGGKKTCAVLCPRTENPKVLTYAKLWKPKFSEEKLIRALEIWIGNYNADHEDFILSEKVIEDIISINKLL